MVGCPYDHFPPIGLFVPQTIGSNATEVPLGSRITSELYRIDTPWSFDTPAICMLP